MKLTLKLDKAEARAKRARDEGPDGGEGEHGAREAKKVRLKVAPAPGEVDAFGDLEAYAEANEYRACADDAGALGAASSSSTLGVLSVPGPRECKVQRFVDFAKGEGDDALGWLKPDHAVRPLVVFPDGRLLVETTSEQASPELGRELRQLLATAAEPQTRPELVEEWRVTPFSLHAAVSIGWTPAAITTSLARLSKFAPLPPAIAAFIEAATKNYGRAKIVLRDNDYWVETRSQEVMEMLLNDDVVRGCVSRADAKHVSHAWMRKRVGIADAMPAAGQQHNADATKPRTVSIVPMDVAAAAKRRYAFVVRGADVERVKERCLPSGLDLPLLEEFDFSGTAEAARRRLLAANPADGNEDDESEDEENRGEDLVPSFFLRGSTKLREYQKTALSKIFAHGSARSGIVVLPCGAGKSLCGVAIAERLKRSTLVLCISAVSVDQWVSQFRLWTTLPHGAVARCTADHKEAWSEGIESGVLVTTYNMVAYNEERRSAASRDFLNFLRGHEWGSLILDEVHVVPADMFRKVIGIVRAHLKVGLTATLVREDDKVSDLHFLIGPKLYEASWIELRDGGYIARVCCYELRCPMDGGGCLEEYMKRVKLAEKRDGDDGPSGAARSGMGGLPFLLAAGNPYKLRALEFLIGYHTKRPFKDGYFAKHPSATAEVPTSVLDGSGLLEDGVSDTMLGRMPPCREGYAADAVKNEARSDRVLVFSDSVYLLEEFARALRYPYIHGEMGHADREFWLQAFRDGVYWKAPGGGLVTEEPTDIYGNALRGMELLRYHRSSGNIPVACNVLFLSKVGDVGLDLPEANVVIQVSSHGGSRRQEAQRLGRILRPKKISGGSSGAAMAAMAFDLGGNRVELHGSCALNPITKFGGGGGGGDAGRTSLPDGTGTLAPRPPPPRPDAFFYTLVSDDTHELLHAMRRRRFLVEQGYTYKVVRDVLSQHALARDDSAYSNVKPRLLPTEEAQRAHVEQLVVHSSERAAAAKAAAAGGGAGGGDDIQEARAALWSGAGGYGNSLKGDGGKKKDNRPRAAIFQKRERELKRRALKKG